MRFPFGTKVRCHGDFVGVITAAWANYDTAVANGVCPESWYELQAFKPSSKAQVFYSVTGNHPSLPHVEGLSRGEVLAGENDVEAVT